MGPRDTGQRELGAQQRSRYPGSDLPGAPVKGLAGQVRSASWTPAGHVGEAGPEAQEAETEDKVYLLSHREFLAYFGVSADALKKTASTKENEVQNLKNLERLDSRIFAKGTQTALANGLWSWTEETTLGYIKFQNIDYSSANGNSAWWLRTVEENSPSACTIAANGDVDSPQYVDSIEGVRPVIRVKR